MHDIIRKLRLDIEEIRRATHRTGPKATKPMRWEGPEINPNGWRTFGHLADDIERLLDALEPDLAEALANNDAARHAESTSEAGSPES